MGHRKACGGSMVELDKGAGPGAVTELIVVEYGNSKRTMRLSKRERKQDCVFGLSRDFV